jgi:uncharacterized oligopeptide transporter (OPT) family protein
VLIAGEKGGTHGRLRVRRRGSGVVYQIFNVIMRYWEETAAYVTARTAALPNARVAQTVSPEYLGVGYILGPRVGGIMVSGSILTFIAVIRSCPC